MLPSGPPRTESRVWTLGSLPLCWTGLGRILGAMSSMEQTELSPEDFIAEALSRKEESSQTDKASSSEDIVGENSASLCRRQKKEEPV